MNFKSSLIHTLFFKKIPVFEEKIQGQSL